MDDTEELDMEVPSLSGSFLNQEASDSMESQPVEEEEEDDDLYYIEPRRPSLDLGPSPMETGALLYFERPKSPAESYLSMSSEGIGASVSSSKENQSSTKFQLIRTGSFSSCYSVDSDDCEIRIKIKSKDVLDDDALPELKETLTDDPQPYLTISFVFKAICGVLQQLSQVYLQLFRGHLWHRYPQSFSSSLQSMDIVDIVDRMLECYSLRVSLQITKAVLQQLEHDWLVDYLEDLETQSEVQYKLRERLKKIYDVIECPGGEERPLVEVYTDLHILSCDNNGPNIEHEVMSIERINDMSDEELCIADITSEEHMVKHREEMVVLCGVAGSGKSMAVRKLIQEWCNESLERRFKLLFVFSIKELKETFGDSSITFFDILHHFYPETKGLSEDQLCVTKCPTLYIFEGLEEISEDLNLQGQPYVFHMDKPGTLGAIFTSILHDILLRSNFFLFTTRPMPKHYIPYDTCHNTLEVLGFKEEAREDYFKKRFRDPSQADRVIKYVKSSRTLQIICHLPLFCSLLADLCQSIFNKQGPEAELPKGITQMYTRLFLALLLDHHKDRRVPVDQLQFIMALGKRAFTMLEKGDYYMCISYGEEFEAVDEYEASAYSGLSTIFLTRNRPFVEDKMFSFMHPTMQEYMAALYVFLTYLNEEKNLFEAPKGKLSFKLSLSKKSSIDLFKSALERSLLCEDGKLDIFMRFLFGLTNSSNIDLLKRFFKPTVKWQSVGEEAAALIREKLSKNQHPARSKNLQLCLEELSLKQETRKRQHINIH